MIKLMVRTYFVPFDNKTLIFTKKHIRIMTGKISAVCNLFLEILFHQNYYWKLLEKHFTVQMSNIFRPVFFKIKYIP